MVFRNGDRVQLAECEVVSATEGWLNAEIVLPGGQRMWVRNKDLTLAAPSEVMGELG